MAIYKASMKFHKGEYEVINKEKYIGSKNPYYKSLYEQRFFYFCDINENVTSWGYECVELHYMYKDIKHDEHVKPHRYYPDIYCEIKDNDGKIKKYIIEIKPKEFLEKPLPPKRKTKNGQIRYLLEMNEWGRNMAKWEVAARFCKDRDMVFKLITQDTLF